MSAYRKPAKPSPHKRRDLTKLEKLVTLANGRQTRWVKNNKEKENSSDECTNNEKQ
jgi:hypothetical protein